MSIEPRGRLARFVVRMIRSLARYAWFRNWFRAAATALGYVTKHPMFIVVPNARLPERGGAPRLQLMPTGAYWSWVLIGFLVVSMPLASNLWAAFALAACAAFWVWALAERVHWLNQIMADMQTKEGWHICSPYWQAKVRAKTWLPCAGIALGFSVIAALMVWRFESDAQARSLGCLALYSVGAVGCLLLQVFASMPSRAGATLPALDSWRASSTQAVRALLDASLHGPSRHPSVSWRTYPDMRSELIRAGLALSLFPESVDKPIWRRSPLYALTYFAPVSMPLLALVVTPLVWPMVTGTSGLDNTTKVMLALSSMVWAAWAIAFFSYFGERDFLAPWRVRQKEPFANVTTELLGFPNRPARALAADFFADKGPTAFNLIALVVVPAFAGYIGLFSAPDKPADPVVSASPVIKESRTRPRFSSASTD